MYFLLQFSPDIDSNLKLLQRLIHKILQMACSLPKEIHTKVTELELHGSDKELPRRFSFWSLLSLSYSLLITWGSFGATFGTSLRDASFAGTIWGLVIAAAITMVLTLGMAEFSSAFETAGAQYYWTYMVSKSEWAPFASYL